MESSTAAGALWGNTLHLYPSGLTFIQPVTEAVVDHTLLPCRDHSDCLLPNMCAVVDVVLKDKYLIWKEETIAEVSREWA